MKKATESPGKMAGGGEEDCGDDGEEFLFLTLVLGKIMKSIRSFPLMDRVSREFGKWKLGRRRIDGRSCVNSRGRSREYEVLTGIGGGSSSWVPGLT